MSTIGFRIPSLSWMVSGFATWLLFCGCDGGQSFWLTISFPNDASRQQSRSLRIAVVNPGELAWCKPLLTGGVKLGAEGYAVQGDVSLDLPIASGVMKLEKVGPGRRLLFAITANEAGQPILNGCADEETGESASTEVTIALEWACHLLQCDDGDACTTDVCDPVAGCSHANNSDPCNDGDTCTSGDKCADGVCTGRPYSCDDRKLCTEDFCDGQGGCQNHYNWTRRREITLTGSTVPLTDHQVRLEIPLAPTMQPDFRELRFLDSNGSLLKHWIENFTEQAPKTATIWVKIPTIPAAGTVIQLYYGNDCVSSIDNSDETFPWITEVVDGLAAAQHTSIALDKNGNPHISYRDNTAKKLKLASNDTASWKTETVDDSTNNGVHSSLALDSNSFAHISYFDMGANSVKYASWDGSIWNIETLEKCEADYGAYTSLALDSRSQPHVSYRRGKTRELKYLTKSGETWSAIQTLDPACTSVTRLRVNQQDHPQIAYLLCDAAVWYVGWNGTIWQPSEVSPGGEYVALALDSTGEPHVAFYGLATGLHFGYFDGKLWQIDKILETAKPGKFLDLYLDRNGRPHISFQDFDTQFALNYAFWDGSRWMIKTVDNDGDAGHDSSLALDSYGFPHIAYVTTGVGLKHAYRRKHALPEPSVTIGIETPVAPGGPGWISEQ